MKNILLAILMIFSLFLSACTSSTIELEDTSSESLQNSADSNESDNEIISDSKETQNEETSSDEILQSEVINSIIEAINNSDAIEISSNVIAPFTSENRIELLEILNLEDKEVVKESNDFGVYGVVVYSTTSNHDLLFTQLSQTEYFIIVDAEHRVYVDVETGDKLTEFFSKLGQESIANGNEKLISDVNNLVNELVVTEIESIYSIKSENVTPLSVEQIDEIKNLLNINSWQLYTGNQNLYGSELKGGVTFANLSQEYGGFEYYTSLNLLEVNGEYIARCYFFEGLGGQNNFSIPKEVYDNILSVSDRIKSQ